MTREARRVVPLVPRRRFAGARFGQYRATRRGEGDEIAGTRQYLPGDPMSTIDWAASARLSAARGQDEFVVRQTFADETPHAVVVNDRSPSMALYPQPSPWLDKPAAVATVLDVVCASVASARGLLGYVDHAEGEERWLRPGASDRRAEVERRHRTVPYLGPSGTLAREIDLVLGHSTEIPPGSFVFLVSDFLRPLPTSAWVRLQRRRLDVVAIVVQDPRWESSFPAVDGIVAPFSDPSTGRPASARLTRAETHDRRREHEERLVTLFRTLAGLGFDSVLIDTSDPGEIMTRFLRWAERRRALRRLR